MRAAALLALAALAGALAGCSEGPEDCKADEDYHPHEERCIGVEQACHAWLSGGVDEGEGDLTCAAESDGHAWLDVRITTSDGFPIEVRDGGGDVVYGRSVQFPGVVELGGEAGTWTLSVDFDDVAGDGSVILWG